MKKEEEEEALSRFCVYTHTQQGNTVEHQQLSRMNNIKKREKEKKKSMCPPFDRRIELQLLYNNIHTQTHTQSTAFFPRRGPYRELLFGSPVTILNSLQGIRIGWLCCDKLGG